MFSGHVGAALDIGRAERDLNFGVLVVAALVLDFLLWKSALESGFCPRPGSRGERGVRIPQGFNSKLSRLI
jgi:hypothetical protein